MAYNAKGKTYTDNPLLDEITYNCKKILNGIVIKNDVLANNSETENSLTYAEMYYIQREEDFIPFSVFPFTRDILLGYGYTDNAAINSYLRDRNNIPEEDRDTLTKYANEYFSDTFEEENDYYRTLNGLPPYNTGEEYFIYLNKGDFPAKYKKNVDYALPIHLQPDNIVNVLYNIGKIDEIRKAHPSSKYSYLEHLGGRRIDLYTARRANKWDILYMPNVYYLVEDKFIEMYKVNRDIYLTQSYQEAYADTGDYYDELMIITVLAQTFADMVTSVPEWYIRRDIFDIRSVKYFLESYGVEFFKEIPLKYQTRIVKNINKLIKFKSSNMNLNDIIEIITRDENVRIIKYWLFKKRLMNEDGSYVVSDNELEKYDMEFITSPIYESYDAYVKDFIYRTPYDDITYMDKYWDGLDTHSYIHDTILGKDFTIQGTKYMSIEYKVSWGEAMFQAEYFLGLILDSKVDLDDIRIQVPSIDDNTDFSISNLFLFLLIVSDSLYRKSLTDEALDIRRPDTSVGNEPTIDENHYNWKKKYIPEIYVTKNNRIHAFNPNFDRIGMENFIKTRRHSHYIFGASYNNVDYDNLGADRPCNDAEYAERASAALDDLMINQFIAPGAKYSHIEEVIDLYRNNRKCYNTLMDKIRWASNEDDISTLAYIYQEMYTREFDDDLYKLSNGTPANNLVEILNERDYVLWECYIAIMQESNIDVRKDQIRSILNDVVESLEYYINGDGLDFVFAFTPIDSFFNIVYYIYLLIGFFKSYKVHFLDPFVTYVIDNKTNPLENTVLTKDVINEWRETNWKEDKGFAVDHLTVEPEMFEKTNEGIIPEESVDIYAFQDRDPFEDTEYDGKTAADNTGDYKELDGGKAREEYTGPCIDVDAGKSYLGPLDTSDVNGGEADEGYHTYYEIDGGKAYHAEDERKDWFGSQGFNYDIDGGACSPYYFRSKTIDVNVKANRVKLDVIISDKEGNKISLLEDGLYIPDFMVKKGDFDKLVLEYNALLDEFTIDSTDAFADVMSVTSFNFIVQRIYNIIQPKLYNMKSSVDDVLRQALLNRLKTFTIEQRQYFYDYYENANPYGWEELSTLRR